MSLYIFHDELSDLELVGGKQNLHLCEVLDVFESLESEHTRILELHEYVFFINFKETGVCKLHNSGSEAAHVFCVLDVAHFHSCSFCLVVDIGLRRHVEELDDLSLEDLLNLEHV
jgi:uncharacterized metal-binding protein